MGGVGSGRRRRCPDCDNLMVKLTGVRRYGKLDAVFWCQECGRKELVVPQDKAHKTPPKTCQLRAWVTEETYRRVKEDAEAEGISISEFLGRLVRDGD
jgi:DNA replicative helicase MCM subunit Mcm2 (Cdc46/Mcm family)